MQAESGLTAPSPVRPARAAARPEHHGTQTDEPDQTLPNAAHDDCPPLAKTPLNQSRVSQTPCSRVVNGSNPSSLPAREISA